MKFQCGNCDRFYRISTENLEKDTTLKCKGCSNKFVITKMGIFSSSSENSKIFCENCGMSLDETERSCSSCNLILNKAHEELRIDNKYYEDIEDSGPTDRSRYIRNTLVSCVVLIILAIPVYFFLLPGNHRPSRNSNTISKLAELLPGQKKTTETQVVVMENGTTYYAKEIKDMGEWVQVLCGDGLLREVKKEDILQISKATIEE